MTPLFRPRLGYTHHSDGPNSAQWLLAPGGPGASWGRDMLSDPMQRKHAARARPENKRALSCHRSSGERLGGGCRRPRALWEAECSSWVTQMARTTVKQPAGALACFSEVLVCRGVLARGRETNSAVPGPSPPDLCDGWPRRKAAAGLQEDVPESHTEKRCLPLFPQEADLTAGQTARSSR